MQEFYRRPWYKVLLFWVLGVCSGGLVLLAALWSLSLRAWLLFERTTVDQAQFVYIQVRTRRCRRVDGVRPIERPAQAPLHPCVSRAAARPEVGHQQGLLHPWPGRHHGAPAARRDRRESPERARVRRPECHPHAGRHRLLQVRYFTFHTVRFIYSRQRRVFEGVPGVPSTFSHEMTAARRAVGAGLQPCSQPQQSRSRRELQYGENLLQVCVALGASREAVAAEAAGRSAANADGRGMQAV